VIRRVLVAIALVTGTAGVATVAVQAAPHTAPAVSHSASVPVCILAVQMTRPHYVCIATSGIFYV
jgi:hypothetical protein